MLTASLHCNQLTSRPASLRAGRRTAAVLAAFVVVVACAGDTAPVVSTTIAHTTAATTTTTVGATTTMTEATTTTTAAELEPITGYGDFSDQEYFAMDWVLVTRLTVQCLQDHGFPVTLIPPGDGISFQSVPTSQNQLAAQYLEACQAGLNLPDYEFPNPEQIEVIYRYYLALRECLIAEGYSVSEPPSLDLFMESFATGPWSPYLSVPGVSGWDSIQMKCPQEPPGGWATWHPGDPITPITPPDS